MFYDFRRFRLRSVWHLLYTAVHRAERTRVSHCPNPSTAIMDSQSVKTVEESARIHGYDAHRCVKRGKWRLLLLIAMLGPTISVPVTLADMHDSPGVRRLAGQGMCTA